MATLHGGPRDAEWAKVEEARAKQQPRTVIELLTGIEKAAFADGSWAEGTRALATRIATEAAIEGLALPVKKLEAAIDTAPEPMLISSESFSVKPASCQRVEP